MSHARCAVSGSAARDRVCAGSTFQRSLGLCLPDCVDDSDCHGRDACVEGLCTKPPADLAQDVQGARQGESQDAQNPEPTEVPDSSEPAAGSGAGGDGSETSGGGAGIGEGGAPLAGACTTGADCASGICEGQGCGDRSGVCADAVRACTQDFVEYCGCDGQTFGGSGSCPGDRYQHVGPCEGEDGSQAGGTDGPGSEVDGGETDPGDRAPASSACTTGADCASGICEGQGCGDGNGVCADALRACTQDFVEYCGCDGQTFGGSGSCPGKRYQHMGPCESEDGSQTSDLAMDGSACTDDDDCASGICEGAGCADNNGTCAPEARPCTRDLRQYCGCDGVVFSASGSCPGARYQEDPSACQGQPGSGEDGSSPGPAGARCTDDADCQDGICEGEGCGDNNGVCVDPVRVCTQDFAEYCGCDGVTFGGSGSCPGKRYEHRGPCRTSD